MSMPFRQKMRSFIAPCGVKEFEKVTQADGSVKTVVKKTDLPDSEKFSTKNLLKAGISLTDPRFAEVDSKFTAFVEPKQPENQGE